MNKHLELLIALQDLANLKIEMENESKLEQFKEMGFELKKLEKIQETIKEVSLEIRSDVLQIYKRVSTKYERPIVPVRNGICYGCFVSLPTARATLDGEMDTVDVCENCGRIIYQIV